MGEYKIGCVIMAAGNSRRFRGNKLAAKLGGKTLIEHALDAIPEGLFLRTVVVTQYPEIMAMALARCLEAVENAHPDFGISHTIKLGTKQLSECDAIMYMVSDQPLLERESIEAVVGMWQRHPERIIAAGSGGIRGNPCIFPQKFFPELMKLTEDNGGSTVIRAHEESLTLVPVAAPELTDIDTPEALQRLERKE